MRKADQQDKTKGPDYHQQPLEISIPVLFAGTQPNHFGAPAASASALRLGKFCGDTREGGSCNVQEIKMIPHCNGTHTECIGHILDERVAVSEVLQEILLEAVLITVMPVPADHTPDAYSPEKAPADRLITRASLVAALGSAAKKLPPALIIRTLPNSSDKRSRNYLHHPPPFFSLEAIRYLGDLPLRHLLVDIPSLDRSNDAGQLNAHRIFWDVEPGSRSARPSSRFDRTITEMIYVPDDVADAFYRVNIQIPHFMSDAAPSRVLMLPV